MAVYFMQAVGGGPVKIGYSKDVDNRREQLESRFGRPLVVLAVIDGGRAEELEIHKRFSSLRIKETEQFIPGPELAEFIGSPLLIESGDTAAEEMKPRSPVTSAILVRSTRKWRKWLEDWANREGIPSSKLIEIALAEKTELVGYEPPPARTGGNGSKTGRTAARCPRRS